MKVFTCTNFVGRFPVGVSAIVVAENIEEAGHVLSARLKSAGLNQGYGAPALRLDEVDLSRPGASILNDGDY